MLGDLIPIIEVQNPRLVNGVKHPARAACVHIVPPLPAEFGGENKLKLVWQIRYYKKVIVEGVETIVYAENRELAPYYVSTIADDTTPIDAEGKPLLKLEGDKWVSDWDNPNCVIIGLDAENNPIKLGELTGLRMASGDATMSAIEKLAQQIIANFNFQDEYYSRYSKADGE